MKRLLFSLLIALTAGNLTAGQELRPYFAYDRETITVDNTKDVFTATKVQSVTNPTNSAALVTFTVNCASGTTCVLRFNVDGTDPTTSVGERALYGDSVKIYGHSNIANFEALRETSTSVIIDVTYYR